MRGSIYGGSHDNNATGRGSLPTCLTLPPIARPDHICIHTEVDNHSRSCLKDGVRLGKCLPRQPWYCCQWRSVGGHTGGRRGDTKEAGWDIDTLRCGRILIQSQSLQKHIPIISQYSPSVCWEFDIFSLFRFYRLTHKAHDVLRN